MQLYSIVQHRIPYLLRVTVCSSLCLHDMFPLHIEKLWFGNIADYSPNVEFCKLILTPCCIKDSATDDETSSADITGSR